MTTCPINLLTTWGNTCAVMVGMQSLSLAGVHQRSATPAWRASDGNKQL